MNSLNPILIEQYNRQLRQDALRCAQQERFVREAAATQRGQQSVPPYVEIARRPVSALLVLWTSLFQTRCHSKLQGMTHPTNIFRGFR
jgi:hypothetical protein